jgi:acyl dehydratase
MPIDDSLVGRTSPAQQRTWNSKDALLYALGVGAGQADPLAELEFTTENSTGIQQVVFPTFACVAMSGGPGLPDDLDFTKMLHAEQSFTLAGAIPTEGSVETTGKITGVYDKGSGALIATESEAKDASGAVLATMQSAVFFRGYGGFGGDRGPKSDWELPTGQPDHVVVYPTRIDQALIYRLTGDRNPLHADPKFAAAGGFERPILHGMCTYGFTGRALLHAAAGSDPARFKGMSGRFTKPIFPGQTLTISIWTDGSNVRFQTKDDTGAVVIDHGKATVA